MILLLDRFRNASLSFFLLKQSLLKNVVGAAGLEPTASRSQSERSTKLSYAPKTGLEVYRLGISISRGNYIFPV